MEILLVEDNPAEAMLVRLTLAEGPGAVNLHIARNGEQAAAIIESADFRASLIILDLNIPRIPGHQLLERLQGSQIPVVIFSSSQSDTDIAQALALGACEYVRKPTDLEEFTAAVHRIVEKWGAKHLHY